MLVLELEAVIYGDMLDICNIFVLLLFILLVIVFVVVGGVVLVAKKSGKFLAFNPNTPIN
jgi:uncharacterized protein YneF (UPF0154 family)